MAKKRRLRKRPLNLYHKIIIAIMFLMLFGSMMIYSTSAYLCSMSSDCHNDPAFYLKRHVIFSVVGLIGAIAFSRFFDYHWLRHFVKPGYGVSILLILLLKTRLGLRSNGATRWLLLGPVSFQVAEAVKVEVILCNACFIEYFIRCMRQAKASIYLWIINGILAAMVLFVSSNLSTAIILGLMTFITTYLYNGNRKLHIISFTAIAAAVIGFIVYLKSHMPSAETLESSSYRLARFVAWLAPEEYASNISYQILQALYAIGRGGLIGKGLGNSIQKINNIPEAQNDMIFSVICEELGIFGAIVLSYMFIYLLYHILKVAVCADLFGSILCVGIMLHVGVQYCINVAVNLNAIPNTGVSLPFISYGGSSLLFLMLEMGIVLSVWRHHETEMEMQRLYKADIRRYGRVDKIPDKKQKRRFGWLPGRKKAA